MTDQEMPRRLPPHCVEDVDRHGNVRVYVRVRKAGRPVKKIRIFGTPFTPEFMVAYDLALKGLPAQPKPQRGGRATEGTWRWLCQQFFASAEFKRLDDGYQTVMRARIEATFDLPIRGGSSYKIGDCPISDMTKKKVRYLRDLKAEFPEGANNRVKAMRNVFKWGMDALEDLVKANPAREVAYFKTGSDGFYTWSLDDVVAFLRRHPPGSMARRALFVFLFTGTRCCNAYLLGRQMRRDDQITYVVGKKRKTDKPKTLTIPLLPVLAAELAMGPQDNLTWLLTSRGQPFKSAKGLGNWFKDRCLEAGLPQCSAHGCRKAGAVIAAENGATDAQMQAIWGWESPKQAADYRKKAQQKLLASVSMQLINFDGAIARAATGTE